MKKLIISGVSLFAVLTANVSADNTFMDRSASSGVSQFASECNSDVLSSWVIIPNREQCNMFSMSIIKIADDMKNRQPKTRILGDLTLPDDDHKNIGPQVQVAARGAVSSYPKNADSRSKLFDGKVNAKFGNVNGVEAGYIHLENINGKETVVVSFHGTENFDDVKTDLGARLVKDMTLGTGGYIHSGFYNRYSAVRNDMYKALEDVLKKSQLNFDNANFLVTGHSLGGALASIAAFDIKNSYKLGDNLDLVTFCSPRVFDRIAAEKVETSLLSHAFRLWRNWDLVPSVGLGSWLLGQLNIGGGYKHVGRSIMLDKIPGSVLAQHSSNAMLESVGSDLSSLRITVDYVGIKDRLKASVLKARDTAVSAISGFASSVASSVKRFFRR